MTLGQISGLSDADLQLSLSKRIEVQIGSLSKRYKELRNLFMQPTEIGGGVQIQKHTAFINDLIELFNTIEVFLNNSGSLQQIRKQVLAAFKFPNSELINFLQALSKSVNIQKKGQEEGSALYQLSSKCDDAIDKFRCLLNRFFERQRES